MEPTAEWDDSSRKTAPLGKTSESRLVSLGRRAVRRMDAHMWALTGLGAVLLLIAAWVVIEVRTEPGDRGSDSFASEDCEQPDDPENCALITDAREAAAGGAYIAAVEYYEAYLALPVPPLAEEIRAEVAALHVDHAEELQAGIRPTTGMGAVYAYADVLIVYSEVTTEYPETDAAQGIPDAVMAMYTTAVTESGADSECDAIVHMNHFAGVLQWPEAEGHQEAIAELLAPVREEAHAQLPGVLFPCGTSMYDAGYYQQAITWLDQFVVNYPDDPNAAEAQETLDSAREEQERVEAENAERLEEEAAAEEAEEEEDYRLNWIQDEIDLVTDGGDWEYIDEPDLTGEAGSGSASLTIYNSSEYNLEVLYFGPEGAAEEDMESGYYSLDACGSCTADCSNPASGTMSVTLPSGLYEVVIRSSGDSVTPLYGDWRLEAGNEYSTCVYVSP
jgi:tetratricopeptide (TPR) repeat protein